MEPGMAAILQQFKERIADAVRSKTPLRLRGGGSKDWYGQAPSGEVLDTRAYCGVIAYEPSELVVTVRCGTPLAELEQVLARKNQMLAFEPPYFGPDATVGGMLACALSGPRRQSAGAVRDFVLGAVLLDGKGEVLHFGGQVMKNVAGYDVSRLLAGSLGTLGLILEVSLKVLPIPMAETSLRFAFSQVEALARLNAWGGQPLPISANAWEDGALTLRLSGVAAAVKAARQQLGGEAVEQAGAFWAALREQDAGFFVPDADAEAGLWRLALPTIAPPLALAGRQLIEWGGGQRWLHSTADAAGIRAVAAQYGGHATLFRGGDKGAGVFQPLAPALATIHRRLKNAFDPAGIFNPGRMYQEF